MIVQNLTKKFNNRVLFSNISFQIDKGLLQIFGASGCGKSTFIKIIMGRIKPTSGKVLFENNNADFAYIGQDASLFYEYSLKINFKLFNLELENEKLNSLLKRFNIKSIFEKPLYLLSGGERKKCEIVFALLKNAYIYILDEPFNSLDKVAKKELINIINELKQNHLVILINHESLNYQFDYNILLDLENNQLTINNNIPDNKITIYHKKKINSFLYIFKNYFKNYKLDIFIKSILVFLCLASFLFACSFRDDNSFKKQEEISLINDPFKMHNLKLSQTNQVNEDLFSEKDLFYTFSFVSDPTKENYTRFFFAETDFVSNDDEIFFKTSKNNFISDSLHFCGYDYTLKNTNELSINSKNYTKSIAQILDNKSDDFDIYLFCKQGFIDKLLINDFDDFYFNKNSYNFVSNIPSFDIYGNFYDQKTVKIIDNQSNKYYISTNKKSIDKITIKNNSNTIEIIENISFNDTQKEELILNLTAYKDFLLHCNRLVLYVNNDTYLRINSFCDFILLDVIKANTYKLKEMSQFLFYLSLALFLIYLIYSIISFVSKKKYYKYLLNIYENNSLSHLSYLRDLFLMRFIILLLSIGIFFIIYVFLGLKLANYVNMIMSFKKSNGFYYYSQQPNNNYYDHILSPIKFLSFNNISLWIFLILSILLIEFYYVIKKVLKNDE